MSTKIGIDATIANCPNSVVTGVHASSYAACGISIFGGHLLSTLSGFGLTTNEVKLAELNTFAPNSVGILHYAPSLFSEKKQSERLLDALRSQRFKKLIVIFHGLYRYNECRYIKDAFCPQQELHVRKIFETADWIVSLSKTVSSAIESWQRRIAIDVPVYQSAHPGLFCQSEKNATQPPYAFLGGISRPKKDCFGAAFRELLSQCHRNNVQIWLHCTNDKGNTIETPVWRFSAGHLTDYLWSNAIVNSKVVLCPYETRVQAVSGIISEAIYARKFVVSTNFEFAREMQRLYPFQIYIEDCLDKWPEIMQNLISLPEASQSYIPSWAVFGATIAKLCMQLASREYESTGREDCLSFERCAM